MSGAFDRVDLDRMGAKLVARGIHPKLIKFFLSWLGNRIAKVVVGGRYSHELMQRNMVYQGTVWGPSLWNLFFEDARHAITTKGFEEVGHPRFRWGG